MVKYGSTRKHLKEEVSKEKVDMSTGRLGVQQREVAKWIVCKALDTNMTHMTTL